MQTLSRLIYISDFDQQNLSSDMITNILFSAKKNNAQQDITGMLLFDYKHFLQVLEGPEEAVNSIYSIIAQDNRHNNVRIIDQKPASSRMFGKWEMGFAHLEQALSDALDIDKPNGQAALALLHAEAEKKAQSAAATVNTW
jgi:hypothetical protein